MEVTWTLLAVIAALLLYIYWNLRNIYTFWERKGVPFLEPIPFIGNLGKVMTAQWSLGEVYKNAYRTFPNSKCVGIYELTKPSLVICDKNLVEKILIKDFQYFVNHTPFSDEKSLFATGLFQMRGMKWRSMRSKISPAFTSGKLRLMFNDMLICSNQLINSINQNVNKDYEIKPHLMEFTMDVIASTVFGIQIKDEASRKKFATMGHSFFDVGLLQFIKNFIILQIPSVGRLFGLSLMSDEAIDYYKHLIMNTLEQRKSGKIQRNDYVQQLLKLKEKGSIEIQANEEEDAYLELKENSAVENIEITDDLLTGQAFQFLSAGFDPLYLTMLLTLFELARNTHIQDRARKHIKEVLKKHNGEYSYESIKDMTFIEQCIQEAMRVNPLVAFLFRECGKTYIDDDLVIDKGQKLVIPLSGIHMDPKNYPNPEIFEPDRLAPNSTRSNNIFMPFGDGPRMCIGLRFALVEIKLAIAKIMDNFSFTLSPKTKVPLVINRKSFIYMPISPILFNMQPVE